MTADVPNSQSAPEDIRFCAHCATAMEVREIGGKPRKACPSCRYVHFVETKVGVGAVVIEAGKLLLVKRKLNPERGKWCVPAGYLDAGERPLDTAIREVLEETGLTVSIAGTPEIFDNPVGAGANLFIMYRAERVSGELQAGDDAVDARFFGLNEIPEIAFDSTHAAVRILWDL